MAYTPAMLWVAADDFNKMRWAGARTSDTGDFVWLPEVDWGAGRHAMAAPALVRWWGVLHAAWVEPDHVIHWSHLDGQHVWSSPQNTGFRTSQKPALGFDANRLLLAWKDVDESAIHWAPMTADGAGWGPEAATDFPTTTGPALGAADDGLYMAWRGRAPDDQLHWTKFNSDIGWFDGPDHRMLGWSAASPALSSANGRLYMAWRGATRPDRDDTQLWWSMLDGSTWRPQRPFAGWSTTGPSLATDGEMLYMAWTEQFPQDGHGQLWWTRMHWTWDDWSPQEPLGSRKSYLTPAIS